MNDLKIPVNLDVTGINDLERVIAHLKNLKPGWKTSEFWVTATILLVNIALTYGFLTNDEAGQLTTSVPIIASAFITVGYAYSRAKAKGLN